MLSQTFFISVFNKVGIRAVHMGQISGGIGQFNGKPPTFGPCVQQPVRLLSKGHDWKRSADWHQIIVMLWQGPLGWMKKKKPQCVLGFRQFYCYLAPHRRVSPLVLVDHRHQKGWAQPCWDPSLNQLEQACRSAYPTAAHIQATYDWCSTEQFPGWFTQVGSD